VIQPTAAIVAEGGPKLHPSDANEKADATAPPNVRPGPDGVPVIPPGSPQRTVKLGLNGQINLVSNQCSMRQLAERLGSDLRWPVHDETGLTGDCAFTLHYLPVGTAGPAPPVTGSSAAGSSADGSTALDVEVAPTIFAAVQSQLGLRLEARKAKVDVLVIDHAEELPIEN
jgi:uncharacterized protein (TIGR03435 family)